MADFIVSGQIPGTQIQITFIIWAAVTLAVFLTIAVRMGFRSKAVRAWLIATRITMAIRNRTIVQN